MDDEDEELILEGGGLHRHLNSCNEANINTFKHDFHKNPASPPFGNQVETRKVLKVSLNCIQRILHSNLLLEEDASFLYEISSDLVMEKDNFLYTKRGGCGISILLILSVCFYLQFDVVRGPLLPCITGLTIMLMSVVKYLLSNSSYNEQVEELMNTLYQTVVTINRIYRSLKEDDALLSAKGASLNRNEEVLQKQSFKSTFSETNSLYIKTRNAIQQFISISRNATFSLMELKRHNTHEHDDYIAFCSDEELGIRPATYSENVYDLVAFEKAKNIHLLMQSENLRLLGICLSQQSSYLPDVFKVVSSYNKDIAKVLKDLRNYYNKYLYPPVLPKARSRTKPVHNDNLVLIHDILKSFKTTFLDMRLLEDYIEENETCSDDVALYINSKLNIVENDLTLILESVKHMNHLIKKTISKVPSQTLKQESKEDFVKNSAVNVTQIPVGASDFSVSGADEVFIGSVSENNQSNTSTEFEDTEPVKPPVTLIRELKTALLRKREEFEQRELKVLKTDEEIEAYKACSSNLPLDAETSPQNIKENVSDSLQINSEEENLRRNFEEACCQLSSFEDSLQKRIALAASNISIGWSAMKNVDCFDDSDSSE